MTNRISWLLTLIVSLSGVAAAPAPEGFLEKLEQKAARSLTAAERAGVSSALRDLVDGMGAPRERFVRDISRITGISEKRVWEFMPRIGGPADQDKNMMPKLQREMGRRLTADELGEIRAADANKKEAITALRQRFATAVSEQVNIAPEDVLAMLPKIGI